MNGATVAQQVLVKKHHTKAEIPAFAKPGDAGADLKAVEDGVLSPGERKLVPTGIAIQLAHGTVGLIHPRSGLANNHGITVLNAPGTVDAGYRGEVKVLLLNTSDKEFTYKVGERIAQLVIQEHLAPALVEADELDDTERGAGGFGSTGA